MKLYCIADEDTVRGFKLAGVAGEVVNDAHAAALALKRVMRDQDLGMLIMTDVVATEIREQVDDIRINHELPLIVEIPGPEGNMRGRKTLREFVQEAVGVRVG